MIYTKTCKTCDGSGVVKVPTNSFAYHFDAEEPIEEYFGCEDCGGTGVEDL